MKQQMKDVILDAKIKDLKSKGKKCVDDLTTDELASLYYEILVFQGGRANNLKIRSRINALLSIRC